MASKLSSDERVLIAKWKKLGNSIRSIAKSLGRAPSTISSELRRNDAAYAAAREFWVQGRSADALFRARRSQASKKMRLKRVEIRHFVELHLKEAHWSPEAIAGKLKRLGYPISAQSIYNFIDFEGRHDLNACLLVRGKSRRRRCPGRKRRAPLKVAAPPKRSIELRPAEVAQRQFLGDFECDALLGKRGGSALQVLVDRVARKIFLKKVPSLCADIYSAALIHQFEQKIPKKYRVSITMDNGAENALHVVVDAKLGVVTFFCHPYCASERGTVENRNKALRRFFPKGVDFDSIPDEYIQWAEDYFNSVPMECLNFATPDEFWNDATRLRKAA